MSESESKSERKKQQFAMIPKNAIEWLVLICVGILPIFNIFFHQFPETISMTMYNGATSELTVFFAETENPDCIPPKSKSQYLSCQKW
ncbi:MAG: hypothetical protein HC803_03900 [Saprospiraceae bacterium]|nr:hypothetical protein [Saprospiraceae bacterium]